MFLKFLRRVKYVYSNISESYEASKFRVAEFRSDGYVGASLTYFALYLSLPFPLISSFIILSYSWRNYKVTELRHTDGLQRQKFQQHQQQPQQLPAKFGITRYKVRPTIGNESPVGSSGITLLFLNLNVRWGWVFNATSQTFYHRETNPVPIVWEAG